MTNRAAPKYEGVLAQPMRLPPEGGADELAERLIALMAHYSIEKMDWDGLMNLTLSLAYDHVPGFRFTAPDPAVPTSKAFRDVMLYSEVAARVEDGESVSEAVRKVLDNHPNCRLSEDSARVLFHHIEQDSVRGERKRANLVRAARVLFGHMS